jgi:hypothetical protein
MSISVVIAYHSGYGHTARQAQAVASGAESVPGVRADLRTAEHLGRRVAQVALQMRQGRLVGAA